MNFDFFYKKGIIHLLWTVKHITKEQWKALDKWCSLLLGLVDRKCLCNVGKDSQVPKVGRWRADERLRLKKIREQALGAPESRAWMQATCLRWLLRRGII